MPLAAAAFLLGLAAPQSGAEQPATPRSLHVPWVWEEAEAKALQQRAAAVQATGELYVATTAAFRVRVPGSRQLAAELAEFLEVFQRAFEHRVEAKPRTAAKVDVHVQRDLAAFRARFPNNEQGFYDFRVDGGGVREIRVFICIPAGVRRLADFDHRILQHEAAHGLLRRIAGPALVSAWFEEGLATWFQFADLRADGLNEPVSRVQRSLYLPALRRAFAEEPPPALADLLLIEHAHWNRDHFGPATERNYALAESLADLLLSTREGRADLAKMLESIAESEGSELPHFILPGRRAEVQRRWHAHVRTLLAG